MKNKSDNFLNFKTKFHKIDGQGAAQEIFLDLFFNSL